MSAANSTNAGTQRGWRQFSLRTLLVLVLFCAVGLLLWNIFVEPSRRQQRLVKQIEQMKGIVRTQAHDTWWSKLLFGDGYLLDIQEVQFLDTKVDNAWLRHLQDTPHLRILGLDGTTIGDVGLAHLPYAKELETLTLGKTATTDVGLRHLESLGRLKLLILQGCAVTDQGMASLAKLSELENLDLRNTRVTDAGIAQLARLAKLRTLKLDNTKVTRASLASLKKMPALREVTIAGTAILPTELCYELPHVQDPKIASALASPTVVEFVETPLLDVCQYLTEFHHVPLIFDSSGRPKGRWVLTANILRESVDPVTANIRGEPLESALKKLLTPLGRRCVSMPGYLLITAEANQRPRPRLRISQSPLPAEVAQRLHSPMILDFVETPLFQVLRYASDYSKLKFVIHEDVAKKLPVTLNIRGLTTATTLEILLSNLDLHGLIRDDAIHIHPGPLPQDSP